MNACHVAGNVVDVLNGKIFSGRVHIENGLVKSIEEVSHTHDNALPYILPGFIDAHVHIESSMLVPSEFARLAVVHGTVATVSDPHEIANVCGIAGVEYMMQNGSTVPFKFYFGAPSCVPATSFETAGAALNASAVELLLLKEEINYLSEMMNFPGVIAGDAEVMQKINKAHALKKTVDGHAPGLTGEALIKYVSAGISTDHECFTKEEALEKIGLGMNIIIREGSAAKNFDALILLLHDHPARMMFCSDDKHPDSLVQGHINELCRRAVVAGVDVFNVLQAACINPVLHYRLKVGLLRPDDPADFIIVNNLKEFRVIQTFIDGRCVAENGKSLIDPPPAGLINNFNCDFITKDDLKCKSADHLFNGMLPVIGAVEGQLITRKIKKRPLILEDEVVSDIENDVLKIVVVNRYRKALPAKAFISNFGLRSGAIASSVAHDSHNIIAVGADDESICKAVNLLIAQKGGISCVTKEKEKILPLPVAGLMSNRNGYEVAKEYTSIDQLAKSLGSTLAAPYMTLSFMALLVIPSLKLSDLGLFDGDTFQFVYSV